MVKQEVTAELRIRNEGLFKDFEDPEKMVRKRADKSLNPFINYASEKQFRLMIKYLKPGQNDKILVVGVGNGRETEVLLKYVKKIYGTDINTNCINYCKERFGNRFFGNTGNIENDRIQFDSNYFDKIICLNVLPYISLKGINNYFMETSRIIKNRGIMLITLRNKKFPLAQTLECHLLNKRLKSNKPVYFSSDLDDYIRIYKEYDFKMESSEGGDLYPDLINRYVKIIFNYRWYRYMNSFTEFGGKTPLKYYFKHLYILLKKYNNIL